MEVDIASSVAVESITDTFESATARGESRLAALSVDASVEPSSVRSDPVIRRKLLASLGTSVEEGGEEEAKSAFARDPVDNAGRRPGEEGYNPRECRIPSDVYAKMTAAKKQYWDYKRSHFDEVVFFQQGDFFNLFANDADIGVNRFGLIYNRALDSVGFNRKQLKEWAAKFSNMGYKVTVLEQDSTATSEEDKATKKSAMSGTKKKATEDRSVTNKVTAGTVSDFDMFDESSTKDAQARYLMVIYEEEVPARASSQYGISFIDTSTYEWGISHFCDDERSSQLETLILRLKPREILFERSMMSKRTRKVIDVNLGQTTLSFLAKFPELPKTQLLISQYFDMSSVDSTSSSSSSSSSSFSSATPPIPEPLSRLLRESVEHPFASSDFDRTSRHGIVSVGATIVYFKELTRSIATSSKANGSADEGRMISSVDMELVSRARFHLYSVHNDPSHRTLVMDATCLSNLDILENAEGVNDRGTLLSVLDHCVTNFGRRKLRQWLCHPLRKVDDILRRQSIVRWFFERSSVMESCRMALGKVKDVERLITRAEAKNISLPLFLNLLDSLELLNAFSAVLKVIKRDSQTYSPIDRYCEDAAKAPKAKDDASIVPIGPVSPEHIEDHMIPEPLAQLIDELPDLSTVLLFFGFDRISARRDGMITPVAGTNESFDSAQSSVASLKQQLDEQMAQYQRDLRDNSLAYHFSKTENYSIVVTRSSTSVPSQWVSTKAKSGNRYWAPEVLALVEELNVAESDLSRASVGALMSCLDAFLFKGFADVCVRAISLAGELDVLLSLARWSCYAVSESVDGGVCLPEPFVCEGRAESFGSNVVSHRYSSLLTVKRPFLEMEVMRHPFVSPSSKGGRFIPNTVCLGSRPDAPGILLVTGPNMGGKSTLLRQVCVIMVMAQLGSYVPAQTCRFTPVDRIFTRIGARDNLIAGQSTFMVELEETAKILAQATQDSLIIMDELGRGTSTFDGYSIAYSVLKHFESQNVRVLFSTHYHKLTQEFNNAKDNNGKHKNITSSKDKSTIDKDVSSKRNNIVRVQQGHMACREDNGTMTFLYTLALGPCPNSFGLEVAAMAHIPHTVLTRASIMSDMFEVMVDRKAAMSSSSMSSSSSAAAAAEASHFTHGTGGVNFFSFVRLLKIMETSIEESKTDDSSSSSSQSSSSTQQQQLQQFWKAEVSRLWRQVRFIQAQQSPQ